MTVKKLTLEEAENTLSVLTFEAKNSIKGGCGHCEGWEEEGATVYTQEEYNYLSSQSLWAGGNVCGIGYVPCPTSESETTTDISIAEDAVIDDMDSTIDDSTTVFTDESEVTGEPETIPEEPATSDDTDSTTDVPTDDEPTTTLPDEPQTTGEPEEADIEWCSWEEMNALANSGEWNGGFVTGMGYVSPPVFIEPDSSGDGTLVDRMAEIVNTASGVIEPVANATTAYYTDITDEAAKNLRGVAKVAGIIGKTANVVGAVSEAYLIYTDENATGWDWAWWATKIGVSAACPLGGAALVVGEMAYKGTEEFREEAKQYINLMEENMKNGSFFLEW